MARNRSITSANAQLFISIVGLYSVPQEIQGYASEDIFDNDSISPIETSMGMDGVLSAGWIPVPIKQGVMLQPNSPSIDFFEAWYSAQEAEREGFFAEGIMQMPSIRRTYAMHAGVLIEYKPLADAKKVLQPRKFAILWEKVIGAPL